MVRPSDYQNASGSGKDIDLSEVFPAWSLPPHGRRRFIKPKLPRDYITKEDCNLAGFDPWAPLRVAKRQLRQFDGRLEPEVPAGTYICKPLFARLVTLPNGRRASSYYCLVMVVAVGPYQRKLIAQYWPYPGEPWDQFERDCGALGIDRAWFDEGCTFESGAILVRVDHLRRSNRPCKEVMVVARLSSALPEEIRRTAAEKPTVQRDWKAITEELKQKAAAAAALYGPPGGRGESQGPAAGPQSQ